MSTLTLAARTAQVRDANESLRMTRELFRAGGVSEVAVLDAERQARAAEVELLAAQAARLQPLPSHLPRTCASAGRRVRPGPDTDCFRAIRKAILLRLGN